MNAPASPSVSKDAIPENPFAAIGSWIIRHIFIRLLIANAVILAVLIVGGILLHLLWPTASEHVDRYYGWVAEAEQERGAAYTLSPWGLDPSLLGVRLANTLITVPLRPPPYRHIAAQKDENRIVYFKNQIVVDDVGQIRRIITFQSKNIAHLFVCMAVPRGFFAIEWLAIAIFPLIAAWHLGAATARREMEAGYYPNTPRSAAYLKIIMYAPALITGLLSLPLPPKIWIFPLDVHAMSLAIVAVAIYAVFNFRRVFVEILG